MSRDEEAKNVKLFDVRVVERNIKKGLVTRKEYDKHVKHLEDVTAKICPHDERSPELTGAYSAAAIRAAEESLGAEEPDLDDEDEDIDDEDDEDEDDDEVAAAEKPAPDIGSN